METHGRRQFLIGSLATGAGLALDGGTTSATAATSVSRHIPKSLAENLPPVLERHGVIGLMLGISHAGAALPLAFGTASVPFKVPTTERTLFHLASAGKHFTAIAVMQQVEQGHVSLDDPIGRHLKDIPDAWSATTVRSLLQHVSGIPDYEGDTFDETRPHTRPQVIAAAAAKPRMFNEGTAWAYSNMNYVLLGYVIEAASGLPYPNYLTSNVIKTAGLVDTRIDAAESLIPLRAEPYVRAADGTFTHARRMSSDYSGYADGPVLVSAGDAPLWDRALESHALVSANAWETMLTPARLRSGLLVPYGCAWFIDQTRGNAFHSHAGGLPGYTSFYLRMPASRTSVMVATNVRLDSARVQQHIAWMAAEAMAPGTTILTLPALADDRPDLTATARKLVLRGDATPDRSLLARELLTVIDGGGRAVWNRRGPGTPRKFELIDQYRLGDGLMRRYRIVFDDIVEHVRVAYTVAGLAYWVFPG